MEWISVKDQLPYDNTDVLVYGVDDSWDNNHEPYFDVAYIHNSSKVRWSNNCLDLFNLKNVTHWMPLPDAPE